MFGIVFDFYQSDLKQLISNMASKKVPMMDAVLKEMKIILYRILQGIDYLHANRVFVN